MKTVITSPAVERVTGRIEFYVADGRVTLAIVHLDDTPAREVVEAIAEHIAVGEKP